MLRNAEEGNYSDTFCLFNHESHFLLKLVVAVIYVLNSVNVKGVYAVMFNVRKLYENHTNFIFVFIRL